jgi:hypothetical protein
MARTQLDPANMSRKWADRLKNAQSDIIAGVNAVTENPMAKAAKRADKMKANLIKAVDDGRWAAGLNAVSLEDWRKKTTDKVAQRLAGGVDGAAAKRQAFDQWLANQINTNIAAIDAMPDMTLQDSINRMIAWTTKMSQTKYKK